MTKYNDKISMNAIAYKEVSQANTFIENISKVNSDSSKLDVIRAVISKVIVKGGLNDLTFEIIYRFNK